MLYSKHITLSSGGTEATASSENFTINKGLIYRAWLIFPKGCAGLVKARVHHHGHPIIPVNKSDYMVGENYVFEIPLFFEVTSQPYRVTFEGWNEDDTYDHTIQVVFSIIPKWIAYPYIMLTQIMEGFTKLFI